MRGAVGAASIHVGGAWKPRCAVYGAHPPPLPISLVSWTLSGPYRTLSTGRLMVTTERGTPCAPLIAASRSFVTEGCWSG